MVDMTLCLNDTCKKRLECFRYMAEPDKKWQSYARFKGGIAEECFEPILPGDHLRKNIR